MQVMEEMTTRQKIASEELDTSRRAERATQHSWVAQKITDLFSSFHLVSLTHAFTEWDKVTEISKLKTTIELRTSKGAAGIINRLWNQTRLRRLTFGLQTWGGMHLLWVQERKAQGRQVMGGIDAVKSILEARSWDKAKMAFMVWHNYIQRVAVSNKLAQDTRILLKSVHESNLVGAARLMNSMLYVHSVHALRHGMQMWREWFIARIREYAMQSSILEHQRTQFR